MDSGRIVVVVENQTGSTLEGDHADGVESIVVYDAYLFSEDGGTLAIGDQEYAYVSADEATGIIVLSGPTSQAYDDGEPVLMRPASMERVATIVPDPDPDEPEFIGDVEATVPHGLFDKIPVGIREVDARESVTFVLTDDGYQVENIVGLAPVTDGSFIDPETIPPTAPVEPSGSPTPVTLGGLRQVFVKYEPVSNATLVEYEVHVTDDSGAPAPTAGDPETLFPSTPTPATLVTVATLPDGTPFEYGTDYYFAVIAKSGDLSAAPSPWVAGHMDRAASDDIVAGAVTTELLDSVLAIVGILQVGDLIEVTPPGGVAGALTGGIIVRDPLNPGGEPLVRLHPLGCSFRGQVVTDILTVMQDLIVNGDASISSGATVKLEGGVSDPSAGPVITQGPIETAWPAIPTGYTEKGLCWDSTNSRWLRLLQRTSNKRGYIQPISTSGDVSSAILLGTPSLGSLAVGGVSGITAVGGFAYYVLMSYSTDNNLAVAFLVRCAMSTGVASDFEWLSMENGTTSFDDDPALGTDGTYVYAAMSGNPASLASGNSSTYASKWSTSVVLQGASILTGSPVSTSADRRFVGVSDFDYGATKLTLAFASSVDVFALPTFSGGSVSKDTALSWTLDKTLSNGGLTYKTTGTDQGFYSEHNDSKLSRWSTYYPTASESFWMKYADTGSGNHTAASPVTSQAIDKRRFAFATLRPAALGVTGGDLYVGYGSTTPATYYLRPESISGRVFTLTAGKDTSGSTTVPSTNTMGGLPGEIFDDFGNTWKGDGVVDLPGLVQTAEYGPDSASATSPFATGLTLTRIGNVVYPSGWFSRASGSSTSFVAAGDIPDGYKPAARYSDTQTFFLSTTTWSVVIETDGAVTIRMSAANTGQMTLNAPWVTADPAP